MAYMTQTRRGMGEYEGSGNWGWEFFPPPYDFLAPPNSAPQPPMSYPGLSGLGGCGCGCKGASGGCGGGHSHGMGLFESGLDYTQWGLAEWGAVILGGYVLIKVVSDAFTVQRGVKKYSARRSKRRAIKQKYARELAAA